MVGHLLNRTLQVWRATPTPDAGGGQAVTRTQVAAVPARVSDPSSTELTLGQRAEARRTHDVYFLPTADVRRGDELRGGGLVLDVIGTMRPSRVVYLKAECESTDSEGA